MKATYIVHWPGKDTWACDAHTIKLQRLGAMLCGAVSATPVITEQECKNCEAEACKESL